MDKRELLQTMWSVFEGALVLMMQEPRCERTHEGLLRSLRDACYRELEHLATEREK